nr:hypothetical protein [Thermoanaerobacterales bacterium]
MRAEVQRSVVSAGLLETPADAGAEAGEQVVDVLRAGPGRGTAVAGRRAGRTGRRCGRGRRRGALPVRRRLTVARAGPAAQAEGRQVGHLGTPHPAGEAARGHAVTAVTAGRGPARGRARGRRRARHRAAGPTGPADAGR